MNVAVIGLGNMGTAVANLMAANGVQVWGWDHFKEVVDEINQAHTNSKYLQGVPLHRELRASTKIGEVLQGKDVVFVALPSEFIRKVLTPQRDHVAPQSLIVNLSKGVEAETCLTASGMLKDIFPNNEIIVLSGPSIANEFSRDLPCGVMLAGEKIASLFKVARLVESRSFRTRFSTDVIGVEWAGILKNIYAIGLGLIDGSGIESINFRSAFITKAVEEMSDLIEAWGGQRRTVYYLAGLGDLIATCLSAHSHNRRLGYLLGKGHSFSEAQEKMGVLPEGIRTLRIAVYLAEKYHTPMPVARGVLGVMEGEFSAECLVRNFMKIGV